MKQLLFFFFAASLFVACNTDEVDDICIAEPDPACFCTMIYDPVCGCDEVTYGNPCMAECSNIFDYTPGPCGE
ncbi:MAG: hypothetical protein AAGJ82_10870 [Bacteroidota bacterium]